VASNIAEVVASFLMSDFLPAIGGHEPTTRSLNLPRASRALSVMNFAIPLPGLVNASTSGPKRVPRPSKHPQRGQPGTIAGVAEREPIVHYNLLLSFAFIPLALGSSTRTDTPRAGLATAAFHHSETPFNRCAHSCYVTRISYFRTVICD
jgi:hypothetical protein